MLLDLFWRNPSNSKLVRKFYTEYRDSDDPKKQKAIYQDPEQFENGEKLYRFRLLLESRNYRPSVDQGSSYFQFTTFNDGLFCLGDKPFIFAAEIENRDALFTMPVIIPIAKNIIATRSVSEYHNWTMEEISAINLKMFYQSTKTVTHSNEQKLKKLINDSKDTNEAQMDEVISKIFPWDVIFNSIK